MHWGSVVRFIYVFCISLLSFCRFVQFATNLLKLSRIRFDGVVDSLIAPLVCLPIHRKVRVVYRYVFCMLVVLLYTIMSCLDCFCATNVSYVYHALDYNLIHTLGTPVPCLVSPPCCNVTSSDVTGSCHFVPRSSLLSPSTHVPSPC